MFSTITMHSPVWDTCLPGQAGTECQSWGFGGQTWGDNWYWLHRDSLNGQERGEVTTKGICRRNVGQHVFPEKAMAIHSSTLAWKIPWTEEPGRLQSMRLLRVRHDWGTSLSLFTFMHWSRKWQPTPVFLPGESQGRRSLVGCRPWGLTESDTTEAT